MADRAAIANRRAAARAQRTQALVRQRRIERYAMARTPQASRSVPVFHEVMAMLERGVSAERVIEAAAALAVAPDEKQGRLL